MGFRYWVLLVVLCWTVALPALADEPATIALQARWALADYPGVPAVEAEILKLTNTERQRHRLPPLSASVPLQVAARQHSTEMHARKYFAHESPVAEWRRPWQRAYFAGHWGEQVGENILMLQDASLTTPQAIAAKCHELWMGSPRHRENILLPRWTLLGVGVFQHDGVIYATQVFAAPVTVLESATLTRAHGELVHLRLQGQQAKDDINIWVNRQRAHSATPQRGAWQAEITLPRHSGTYELLAGTGNTATWRAQLDTDREPPALEIVRPGLVAQYAITLAPFTGYRLAATARVPKGKRDVLLVRDKMAVASLTPDKHGNIAFALVLPPQTQPYAIGIALDGLIENLLFVDALLPPEQAFRGRPD
jgi:uncharacterized protein YkwD